MSKKKSGKVRLRKTWEIITKISKTITIFMRFNIMIICEPEKKKYYENLENHYENLENHYQDLENHYELNLCYIDIMSKKINEN